MQKQLAEVDISDTYKLSSFLYFEAVFQSSLFVEKFLNANKEKWKSPAIPTVLTVAVKLQRSWDSPGIITKNSVLLKYLGQAWTVCILKPGPQPTPTPTPPPLPSPHCPLA